MTEVSRKQKDGSIVNVRCPKVLKQYTQNMNGVNRADQLRSTYSICRKADKWWKYLFWFMVDVAICNSFNLMKESINHSNTTKSGVQNEAGPSAFGRLLGEKEEGIHLRSSDERTYSLANRDGQKAHM